MISPEGCASDFEFCRSLQTGPLHVVISIALGLITSVAMAQPTIDWMKQFGSENSDGAADIAIDNFGNLLIVGNTQGDLFGENLDVNPNGFDGFLIKLDSNGTLLWHKRFSAPAPNSAESVGTDAAANVYVAGSFGSLSKFDTQGSELWTASAESSSTHHFTTSNIDIASDGSVYMAGYAARRRCCRWDSYISKYDNDGMLAWTQIFEDPNLSMSIESIAVDEIGNAYVSGTTGLFNGFGEHDAFVAKLDASGSEKWRRQFGTEAFDGSSSLAIDELGTIYVAGSTEGNLGAPNLGGADIFVSSWDSEGNQLWVVQHGSTRDEQAAVTAAISGGVYFSGSVHSRVMFEFTTADAIVGQLDANGNLLWSTQFGTDVGDRAAASAVDGDGTLYVVGSTSGSLAATNAGPNDIFVVKFIPTPEPTTATILVPVGLLLGVIRRSRTNC